MNFIFHNEVIDYDFFYKPNSPTIIFLHGWGGNKFSFSSTLNLLKQHYSILTLTIPTTQETNLVWTMEDYCCLVELLCISLNIKSAYIVCHSFGFRVATLLKDKIKINKIIITGGAGLKKINIFQKFNKNNNKILLKCNKFDYLFKKIASKDYLNLSQTNKESFKNIVNYKTNCLIKFNCPLLLFWGKETEKHRFGWPKKLRKLTTQNWLSQMLIILHI